MSDPVVGECARLLKQLALFLGGLDGLLNPEDTGVIMVGNGRFSLLSSGGGSYLGDGLGLVMLSLARLLRGCVLADAAVCLDSLRRTTNSDTTVGIRRC